MYRKRNRWRRKRSRPRRGFTRHHNRAASLGGDWNSENIFMLTPKHHQAFHTLFGLRTFKEAAKVLMRLEQLHKQIAA